MTPDLFRTLRDRQFALRDRTDRRDGSRPVANGPAFVGCVFANPAVPTSTGKYFSVHPVTILGTEGESNPGALSVDTTRTALVYVIGSKAPVAGDYLVCRFVGSRWIAERMAKPQAQLITIPGCPCTTIPPVLQMTSSNTTANNGLFQSTSLVYGPTPPEFTPLGLGASCFLSPSYFTDNSTGDHFRYYFGCFSGFYIITRVFQVSILGSPYKDTIRYKWFVGFPGNTCSPFLLSNGQIYVGGDPSSVVTISS
jgi:hypothetical protein